MTYVGIDLHSTNMVIVALNSNGECIKQDRIACSPKALDEFFSSFSGPIKAVVECTCFWFWLADWFRSRDIPLQLAHAKMVKAISYAKVKTDKVDALTLAKLLKSDLIPEAYQIHIGRLEEAIEQQTGFGEDAKRLLELPGFGLVTVWTVLAEIGDINRFPTAKQFASYCRLVPGSKDSGGTRRHKSGCKDGNKYLRVAFSQAAIHAYTHYKPVRAFYKKIKRRSGPQVARVVVAKHLAIIVWHMLAKDQPYKGFKGQPTKSVTHAYWPQPISPNA
ncbi:MAG: transposase [Balneolaceae bacterium]